MVVICCDGSFHVSAVMEEPVDFVFALEENVPNPLGSAARSTIARCF